MHVGCAETKPSDRCLRKRQRFAIRLRHGLRFLNWITNGSSYRVTISSVMIARNSERCREKCATSDIRVAGDGSSGLSAHFLPPAYDRCDRSRSISRRKPHPFYLSYLPGRAGSWYFHVRIRPRFRFIRDWFYERLRRDVVWYIGIAVVILVLVLPGVINIRYRYSSYFTS